MDIRKSCGQDIARLFGARVILLLCSQLMIETFNERRLVAKDGLKAPPQSDIVNWIEVAQDLWASSWI